MAFCDSKLMKVFLPLTLFAVAGATMTTAARAAGLGAPSASAQTNAARPVGTIKSISGNNILLTTDAGSDLSVVVQEGARLLRVEPGEKDLKQAVPIALPELLPGDRILVVTSSERGARAAPTEASSRRRNSCVALSGALRGRFL